MIKHVFDVNKMLTARKIVRTIHQPKRLALIKMVIENQRLNVTQIYKGLNISQVLASQDLKLLKNCGILNSKKEGREIYYSVSNELLKILSDCINKLTADK